METPSRYSPFDPTKNMRPFYRLDVRLDLFGEWRRVSEWRRTGCAGGLQMTPFGTVQDAQSALGRQLCAKERRGYSAKIFSLTTASFGVSISLYRR